MTRRRYKFREPIARLLLTLSVLFGAVWLAPPPPAAQAAPAPAVAASRAPLAAARPAQNPPLPEPFPTLLVTTTNIADDPNDGQCDLWEAMQAVVNAALDTNNGAYHECQAQAGQPNVIGFSNGVQGATIVVPASINGGELPYAWGNETILGPITLKAESTDTHLIRPGPEATLTFISVTFSGAHTTGGGAAILDDNFATINLYGCIFTSNIADENGGAISSGGSLNIVQTSFTNNQAMGVATNTGNGGAIALYGVGTLNISLSKFTNNSSHAGGGALYVLTPNASIEDTQFLDNQGGLNETIPQGGGALINDSNGSLSIARTDFDGNQSPQGSGGAVFNNAGATLVISDTSFTTNQAGDASHGMSGGAVFNSGLLTVTRSSFSKNVSLTGEGGGLVDDLGGDAIVANSLFAFNTAPAGLGAALVVSQTQIGGPVSHLLLLNDTVSQNGSVSDAGLWASAGQDLTLGNTLLVNNPVGNCAGDAPNSEGHNLDSGTSCHLTAGGDLSGNSHANLDAPTFNGGALPTLLSMLPVLPSSAIDSGDGVLCDADPVSKVDERGSPRPINGMTPGNQNPACDIGAIETDAPSPRFGSTPSSPGPIDVGHVQVSHPASTILQISNSGNYRLQITNLALSGPNAGDFGLVSAAPFSIDAGAPPVNLTITCTPSAASLRTATLTLDTDDTPDYATVQYQLLCTGAPSPVSGFSPSPSPASPISFPGTEYGATSGLPIAIGNNGNAVLNVVIGALAGANAADFHVVGSNFSVNPGSAPHAITIQCTPNDYGLLTATLTLTTNDSTQPTIVYNLSCLGKPAPSPYLLPAGSAVTNSPTDHGLNNVFGVAITPDGKHLYATSYADGTISSFARDLASGALTYLGKDSFAFIHSYTAGARQLAVSPDNQDVVIAGETFNDLLIGVPNPATGRLDTFPHGATSPTGDHSLDGAFGAAFSPDGHFIYATGHLGDAVLVYKHDAPNHDLIFVQAFVNASVLAGPYGLALTPDGQHVYVAGWTNNSLEVLSRDPISGKLTHVQYRHQGDTIDNATLGVLSGMQGAFEVAVSPDGANVYLTARSDGDVVEFRRSLGDGHLTWIGDFRCGCGAVDGLSNATGLDVTPDGQHVIADGNGTAAVLVLDRDPLTGLLTFHEEQTQTSISLPMAGPADLRISPDGRSAYIAAYNSTSLVMLPVGNPQPVLTHISPASAVQNGAAFTLHVFGANFLPNTAVYFGPHTPPVTYISPYQLDIIVDSSFLATAGPVAVQLKTPEPGGNDAFSFIKNFVVSSPASPQNPVPSIDHIAPQGQPSGRSAVTLDVYGTSFINGSTINFNGAAHATTFVNSGHLQTTLPQSAVSQPGVSSVTVSTGALGGGLSNAVSFTVAPPGQNAVATLNGVSPLNVFSHGAGSKDLQVTLTGHHFILGAVGQFNGSNRPTQFVDSTHLKVTLFGSDLSAPSSTAITVFIPAPGGGVSNPLTIVIRKLFQSFMPLVRR